MVRFLYTSLIVVFIIFNAKSQDSINITQKRPTIGIVLSGGGAKGFAHVGVLKVLEELGIQPDYIAGTSMGSLVGGLYACGYKSKDITKITHDQNWTELLTDKLNRRSLSIFEKTRADRIFVPITIKDNKAKLSAGLMSGQKVHRLLSDLTWNVYKDTNFNTLPIPFFCGACNLAKGQINYLDHGSIADDMRASMAIPGVFDPIIIDSNVYVDGGIVDNFPVLEMKRKYNPDIIIGVDVGYKVKEVANLNTITGILEQVIFNPAIPKNRKNREACNILLIPDLKTYGTSSFTDADSIIACGYRAAMAIYPQLKKLADSLKNIAPLKQPVIFKDLDSIYIDKIEIYGLKKVPSKVLLRKLNLDIPGKVHRDKLEEGINDAFSTLLFNSINYKLEYHSENKTTLVVRAIEKDDAIFTVGVHFDVDTRTGILLSTAVRNFAVKGTELTADLVLGDNPKATLNYLFYSNWGGSKVKTKTRWFSPDFGFTIDARSMGLYLYDSTGNKETGINYNDLTGDIYITNNLSNFNSLTFGTSFGVSSVNASINPLNFKNITYTIATVYLNYRFDALDDFYYPTRGIFLNVDGKLVNDITKPDYYSFFGNCRWYKPISIGKRVCLIPGAAGGTTYGDVVPSNYFFFLGGLGNAYYRGFSPFIGLEYMEKVCESYWIGRLDLRVKIIKNVYTTIKLNVGQTGEQLFQEFDKTPFLYGGGLYLSYKSIIGPIEVAWSPSMTREPMYYFSMGFNL